MSKKSYIKAEKETFASEIQEADVNIETYRRVRQEKEGRKYTGPKANRLFKQAKQGNKNPNRPKPRPGAEPLLASPSRWNRRAFYNASLSKKEHSVYKQMGYVIAEAFGHRVEEEYKVTVDRYGKNWAKKARSKSGPSNKRTFTGQKGRNIVKAVKKREESGKNVQRERDLISGKKLSSRMVTNPDTRSNTRVSVKKESTAYHIIGRAIAEAFAGPIASKYGDERGVKSVARKTRDRSVVAGAAKAKKTIDNKVGVKTNPKAKDLVQVAMNKRRKSRSLPPGPFKTPRSYNK